MVKQYKFNHAIWQISVTTKSVPKEHMSSAGVDWQEAQQTDKQTERCDPNVTAW